MIFLSYSSLAKMRVASKSACSASPLWSPKLKSERHLKMQKGIWPLRKKGHEWGKAGFPSANSENHWESKGWCVHLWLTSCQKQYSLINNSSYEHIKNSCGCRQKGKKITISHILYGKWNIVQMLYEVLDSYVSYVMLFVAVKCVIIDEQFFKLILFSIFNLPFLI